VFSQIFFIFTVGTKNEPGSGSYVLTYKKTKSGSGTEAVVSLTFLPVKIYG